LLWAKKVFKTKPNREISVDFKEKIHTIFHHLTKEELINKVLANYLEQYKSTTPFDSEEQLPKKKKR
jgi:ATP-dependent RNA helicase DeaD